MHPCVLQQVSSLTYCTKELAVCVGVNVHRSTKHSVVFWTIQLVLYRFSISFSLVCNHFRQENGKLPQT